MKFRADPNDFMDMVNKKFNVTMVAWNCDDSMVITAQNNFVIKVWNSNDAQLVHELKSHSNEIFVLEAHPKDARILLSAGHDGNIIIWNILTGKVIKKFYNRIENEGHGCLFDSKWSCTSDMFASTDSHGNLAIFSFGLDEKYKQVPDQLFFHTDYRPLTRLQNGLVLDEQTHVSPHAMPPPFLVDADGNPYSSELQRLVPGRENLTDAQLIPHIITNENGLSEIIGDRDADEAELETVRNRNAWLKNLISPLDMAALRISESSRLQRFQHEAYDYHHGFKQLVTNQRGSVYIYRDEHSKDSFGKRAARNKNRKIRVDQIEEDSVDENFIEVEDDSNSRHSNELSRSRTSRRVEYLENLENGATSSEGSEWDEGRLTLRTPRLRKKNTKRVLRVVDDDEAPDPANNTDDEISRPKSKSTIAKKLKKMHSDEEMEEIDQESNTEMESEETESENDENVDPNRPCTSKAAASKSPRKNAKKQKRKCKNSINSKVPIQLGKKMTKSSSKTSKLNDTELPAEFIPPEWLSSVKPRKTPYVPQIGDEVVYFRQGHELYIQAVREKQLYELDEKTVPSVKCQVKEFCKVTSINIEIKPPRLVCLKLNVIEPTSGDLTGHKLTLKYHDMPGVADFVILRQHYEKSLEKNWQAQDKFRSYIDDSWYYGTIVARKPFQPEYPQSEFQCFSIEWDNGDHDALSPWDLDEAPSRKLNDELGSLLYEPNLDEWHGFDRDTQCERILNGIEIIRELSIAEPFNLPVDLIAFPQYAMVIGYPIDLNTIKERVANRYYRRLEAIEWDIRKIMEDAHEFNEPESTICKQATLLTQVLIEFILDPDCSNPRPIYKRLCKDSNLNETQQASPNTSRRVSRRIRTDTQLETSNLRFNLRSRQHAEESNQGPLEQEQSLNSWKDQAKKLIKRVISHPDSEPFRQSVDIDAYPDYCEKIKKPIDFSVIRSRLCYNMYTNEDFNQFEKDCRLVFKNSKAYNTNKKSDIYRMTLRLELFFEEKLTPIRQKYEAEYEKPRSNRSRYHLLLHFFHFTHLIS